MKRQASIERSTKETKIKASVDLDGTGAYDIATGQQDYWLASNWTMGNSGTTGKTGAQF